MEAIMDGASLALALPDRRTDRGADRVFLSRPSRATVFFEFHGFFLEG